MKTLYIAIIAVSCLVIGFFAGKAIFFNPPQQEVAEDSIWTCSMHPSVRSEEPGLCPICGMDLIPADEAGGSDMAGISMSPDAIMLAGIRTEIVGSSNLSKSISLPGKIAQDQGREAVQTAHIGGRIEAFFVDFEGEKIEKGQLIAEIYSPALISAQEELLQAAKYKESNPVLFESARQKLKNWKLTEDQIESIISSQQPQTTFPILSDVTGVVIERYVNLGDHVMEGSPMFRVNDLSSVWALFDVYERQLESISLGEEIKFTTNAYAGEVFKGEIDFVDPVINPATRTLEVRANVNNADGRLKPEMFIEGKLTADVGEVSSLTIPRTAVLWTGKRSVVYVQKKMDDGTPLFVLKEVNIGDMGDGDVEILSGLEIGEEVVVEGAFTIDAAAELSGKTSMMTMDHSSIQEASDEDVESFEPVLMAYLLLKDSLVAGNYKSAEGYLYEMQEAWASMPDPVAFEEKDWTGFEEDLNSVLKIALASKDLESLRKSFKPLSSVMIRAVDQFGLTDTALYVQYCPMADENQGADWISMSPLIRNPYYGSQMLKCGSISKEIKP